MVEALAAIFMPAIVVLIVFLYVGWNRYLKHRERMAMIEKGLVPDLTDSDEGEEPVRSRRRRNRLDTGLITAAIGLALTLGLSSLGFGPWLLGGLIPLFVGLANILAYLLQPDTEHAGAKGGPGGTG
ncbi:MAG: DUF6249 domain-containing protein [Bacillota bacterium]|nr:MAG: hypothetical protein DIU69_01145 [Bacillota bacterium]